MIVYKNWASNRLKKCKYLWKGFVILTVLLTCTVFFLFYFWAVQSRKNIVDLSNNWEIYTKSTNKKIQISNIKHLGNNKPGETIYLSKILEATEGLDTLLLKSNHQYLNVYLDEVKLFDSPAAANEDPGMGLYFIPLPPGYEGKTLYIEFTSPFIRYAKAAEPVYLGTVATLYTFIFSEAFPNLFYFIFCLITGCFLIAYSIYTKLNNVSQKDILYLGIFSVLWGAYCISWDNIMCILFSPVVISKVSAVLHIIYMLPFFMYFRFNFTAGGRFVSVLSVVFCCMDVIMCILLFMSAIEFPDAVLIYNYILVAVFAPMVIISCIEFKRGNPLIRFLSPTILLIIVGVIGTILEFLSIANGMFFYLFSIFIFICFNWAYYLKKILAQYIQKKKELEILELKNTLILDKYEEMQSRLEKTHKIQHEVNHHIAAIQILCKEGNINGINDYLSAVSSNVLVTPNITYSKHPIVDCILYNYAIQARNMDISFDCLINIPKSLPVSDVDLCSLLLNMLDNAIEANAVCQIKWIQFKMVLKEHFLIISCKNSYIGTISHENGKIVTGKPDKKFHGYGISVMESIAEKYGSKLIILYNSENFMVKTVLQL